MTDKNKKIIVGVIALIVLVGGAYLLYDAKVPLPVDTDTSRANENSPVPPESTPDSSVETTIQTSGLGLPTAGFPPRNEKVQ